MCDVQASARPPWQVSNRRGRKEKHKGHLQQSLTAYWGAEHHNAMDKHRVQSLAKLPAAAFLAALDRPTYDGKNTRTGLVVL
jgi:hypothetical protein